MLFCSLHLSIHRSTRYGLLPVSPSQNHSSRREHSERRTPPKNSPENHWLPRAHQTTATRPRNGTTQEEQTKYTIYLLYVAGVGEDLRRVCRKFDIRMVFTTMSTQRQQLTIVKDTDPTSRNQCRVQDTLQLQTGIHRRNQEKSWNPPQGKSNLSSHQTRRDRQVSNCRACLGKTTPPPMGQHHYTWARTEPHHLADQGSITHHVGRATLTPQTRSREHPSWTVGDHFWRALLDG